MFWTLQNLTIGWCNCYERSLKDHLLCWCLSVFLADEDDLETVVTELDSIVDVRGVGLRLGLRMSALQKIREDERTLEKEKMKILQHWLMRKDMIRGKEEVVPSWSRLADAVEKENRALSIQIRKKYSPESVARK